MALHSGAGVRSASVAVAAIYIFLGGPIVYVYMKLHTISRANTWVVLYIIYIHAIYMAIASFVFLLFGIWANLKWMKQCYVSDLLLSFGAHVCICIWLIHAADANVTKGIIAGFLFLMTALSIFSIIVVVAYHRSTGKFAYKMPAFFCGWNRRVKDAMPFKRDPGGPGNAIQETQTGQCCATVQQTQTFQVPVELMQQKGACPGLIPQGLLGGLLPQPDACLGGLMPQPDACLGGFMPQQEVCPGGLMPQQQVCPGGLTPQVCPGGLTPQQQVCPGGLMPQQQVCPGGLTQQQVCPGGLTPQQVCPGGLMPQQQVCPGGLMPRQGTCSDGLMQQQEGLCGQKQQQQQQGGRLLQQQAGMGGLMQQQAGLGGLIKQCQQGFGGLKQAQQAGCPGLVRPGFQGGLGRPCLPQVGFPYGLGGRQRGMCRGMLPAGFQPGLYESVPQQAELDGSMQPHQGLQYGLDEPIQPQLGLQPGVGPQQPTGLESMQPQFQRGMYEPGQPQQAGYHRGLNEPLNPQQATYQRGLNEPLNPQQAGYQRGLNEPLNPQSAGVQPALGDPMGQQQPGLKHEVESPQPQTESQSGPDESKKEKKGKKDKKEKKKKSDGSKREKKQKEQQDEAIQQKPAGLDASTQPPKTGLSRDKDGSQASGTQQKGTDTTKKKSKTKRQKKQTRFQEVEESSQQTPTGDRSKPSQKSAMSSSRQPQHIGFQCGFDKTKPLQLCEHGFNVTPGRYFKCRRCCREDQDSDQFIHERSAIFTSNDGSDETTSDSDRVVTLRLRKRYSRSVDKTAYPRKRITGNFQ